LSGGWGQMVDGELGTGSSGGEGASGASDSAGSLERDRGEVAGGRRRGDGAARSGEGGLERRHGQMEDGGACLGCGGRE
jgi:hypothetical protein